MTDNFLRSFKGTSKVFASMLVIVFPLMSSVSIDRLMRREKEEIIDSSWVSKITNYLRSILTLDKLARLLNGINSFLIELTCYN